MNIIKGKSTKIAVKFIYQKGDARMFNIMLKGLGVFVVMGALSSPVVAAENYGHLPKTHHLRGSHIHSELGQVAVQVTVDPWPCGPL